MMRTVKKNGQNFVAYYLAAIIFFLQLSGPLLDGRAFLFAGDQTCSEKLDIAEEYYYDDAFDEAQALVQDCLNDLSLKKVERIRAYTILARIYLARENPEAAKEFILKIFSLDPAYQPTIEQETPRFVNLVTEAKKEFVVPAPIAESAKTSKKKSGKRWLWIGAGTAAVIAIIAVVASGSKGEKPVQERLLPNPPPFPQ